LASPTSKGLRYLKARSPKVEAVQLMLEDGVDRVSSDGIRTRWLMASLGELV
jgi:hypothetical protein